MSSQAESAHVRWRCGRYISGVPAQLTSNELKLATEVGMMKVLMSERSRSAAVRIDRRRRRRTRCASGAAAAGCTRRMYATSMRWWVVAAETAIGAAAASRDMQGETADTLYLFGSWTTTPAYRQMPGRERAVKRHAEPAHSSAAKEQSLGAQQSDRRHAGPRRRGLRRQSHPSAASRAFKPYPTKLLPRRRR